jgi:hypothetical protein
MAHNIALTLIKRITIPYSDTSSVVTNCFFMPNKEMIFIDTANRKLHIHDKHGALHHSGINYIRNNLNEKFAHFEFFE